MGEEVKEVSFNSLGEAIGFVDEKAKFAENAMQGFAQSFKELTGFMPGDRVSALDVVKIFEKLSDKGE